VFTFTPLLFFYMPLLTVINQEKSADFFVFFDGIGLSIHRKRKYLWLKKLSKLFTGDFSFSNRI